MSLLDEPRCGTCFWFHRGKPIYATWETVPGDPETFVGSCMLRPPVVVGTDPAKARSMFPGVHENRCCSFWECGDDGTDDGEPAVAVPINRHAA